MLVIDLPLGPGRFLRPYGVLLKERRSLSSMTSDVDIAASSNSTKAIMIGMKENKSRIIAIVGVKGCCTDT